MDDLSNSRIEGSPHTTIVHVNGQSIFVRREFPEAPIIGVGAVVLDGDHVLLVRRGQAPLKGEWSIPGGALELGETLEHGVQREIAEETGLNVEVVNLVEVIDRIVFAPIENTPGTKMAPARVQYHYVLVDYLCVPTGGDLVCGSDTTEARWVQRAELGQYGLAPMTISVIEKAFEMPQNGRHREA